MIAAIAGLGPWAWIIAGMLLMLAELFAPGLFLIWLGLAALATGIAVAGLGLGWAAAALVFCVLAIAAVVAGRQLTRGRGFEPGASAGLNALSRDLIGKVVRLDQAIEAGTGQVRIGDTVWRALGPDAPAGVKVRIVGLEGSALRVEMA